MLDGKTDRQKNRKQYAPSTTSKLGHIKIYYFVLLLLDRLNPLYSGVILQTVKTQMKCIMLHFIRVYTVCKGKNDLQAK